MPFICFHQSFAFCSDTDLVFTSCCFFIFSVDRRVTKCGYLFVGPIDLELEKLMTLKKWQRRWFVLYDDGELTFSVDENPLTIPQVVCNKWD